MVWPRRPGRGGARRRHPGTGASALVGGGERRTGRDGQHAEWPFGNTREIGVGAGPNRLGRVDGVQGGPALKRWRARAGWQETPATRCSSGAVHASTRLRGRGRGRGRGFGRGRAGGLGRGDGRRGGAWRPVLERGRLVLLTT